MRTLPCPAQPVHAEIEWTVIRVRLEGDLQAHVHPVAGVVVVDSRLSEDVVDAVLAEASAGAAEDWTRAPHAVRQQPPLRVLPGGAS